MKITATTVTTERFKSLISFCASLAAPASPFTSGDPLSQASPRTPVLARLPTKMPEETTFQYSFRFGTQDNDEKARAQNEKFNSMSKAASLASGGSKAFTPKDLELFEASEAQQRSCFRGYDKVTTNPPGHGKLPKWSIRPEVFERLQRGF